MKPFLILPMADQARRNQIDAAIAGCRAGAACRHEKIRALYSGISRKTFRESFRSGPEHFWPPQKRRRAHAFPCPKARWKFGELPASRPGGRWRVRRRREAYEVKRDVYLAGRNVLGIAGEQNPQMSGSVLPHRIRVTAFEKEVGFGTIKPEVVVDMPFHPGDQGAILDERVDIGSGDHSFNGLGEVCPADGLGMAVVGSRLERLHHHGLVQGGADEDHWKLLSRISRSNRGQQISALPVWQIPIDDNEVKSPRLDYLTALRECFGNGYPGYFRQLLIQNPLRGFAVLDVENLLQGRSGLRTVFGIGLSR